MNDTVGKPTPPNAGPGSEPGVPATTGPASAVPRPASTVVVVRDAAGGAEVLLLRRPPTGFAADAWVFPGGAVDSDDYRLEPPGAEQLDAWCTRLEVQDPGLAWGHVVAALRETWEETGLWLGAGPDPAADIRALRGMVLDGSESFSSIAARSRMLADCASLIYIARWVTPPTQPRRYDTRFFLTEAGVDSSVQLQGDELLDAAWMRPEDALEAQAYGRMHLMVPTIHTLRRMQGFNSVARLLADLSSLPPTSFPPRMRSGPEGVKIDATP